MEFACFNAVSSLDKLLLLLFFPICYFFVGLSYCLTAVKGSHIPNIMLSVRILTVTNYLLFWFYTPEHWT